MEPVRPHSDPEPTEVVRTSPTHEGRPSGWKRRTERFRWTASQTPSSSQVEIKEGKVRHAGVGPERSGCPERL